LALTIVASRLDPAAFRRERAAGPPRRRELLATFPAVSIPLGSAASTRRTAAPGRGRRFALLQRHRRAATVAPPSHRGGGNAGPRPWQSLQQQAAIPIARSTARATRRTVALAVRRCVPRAPRRRATAAA